MFLGALVYGLVNAAILTLYALGFNLTFGVSGIANFAYGSLYVLTGYAAWSALNTLKAPLAAALPAAVLLTALVGGAVHRLVLVRLQGLREAQVIATFGLGLTLLEALRYFGFIGHQFALPVFWDSAVDLAGVVLDGQRIIILAASLGLTAGLWGFTHHTRIGLACRGMAQDERTALCLGIDSDWTATAAMALGGGLCAVGAVVVLPIGNIAVESGYDVLLEALAVCIVGGLGSAAGVVAAAVMLGLSQTLAAMYLGAHWMMIVTLLAILVVLIVRPSGLFGHKKELEERT
ncbi:MAG: branched-chain amino acid ABC transporter permease [Thermodesulfobacteriota bacterium]